MITPRVSSSNVDVSNHYDELDDFYRQIWGEHLHHGLWTTGDESVETAVTALIKMVADAAGIERGAKICDVGAGYGGTARYLSEVYGAQVTALTISKAQHQYATGYAAGQPAVDYMLGDWFENEFPERTFDAVIAIESTAHMADKAGFFRETRRVLRPGGRAVVCAWLAAEEPSERQVKYLLEPICREGRLPGLGSRSEYQRWITEFGLDLESYADLSGRVQQTWSVSFRRALMKLLRDPQYIRFLVDSSKKNRRFVFTIPRMWTAYQLGALRYGLFVARKPV